MNKTGKDKGVSRDARNSVLVQAGILAVASMIVRIIGLLYRAPLTAIIGDEGNGYYGTAYNIYTIILMVSSYSIPSAVSKLMAQKLAVGEYRNAQRVYKCALLYGIIVGIAGSALLFFGAELLVPPVAAGVLRVFAPIVFLFGILGSLRGYFQGHGSMVQTSVSQILEQLANAVISITAAWLLMRLAAGNDTTRQAQLGAMGSALGTGAGVLTALVFVFIYYKKYSRKNADLIAGSTSEKLIPYRQLFKETVMVITPFMLSGFILNLTTSLNQTIYLQLMIGLKGMDQIEATTLYGIFSNKAVVISNIPISIATAVAAAIIPGISAAYAKGDIESAAQRTINATRMTSMIAIPSAVGLAVLARPITMLMFPQMASLFEASLFLAMLAITVVFYSISTITNAALQSIGKMNMPLVSAGIALTIQTVILVLMLIFTDFGIFTLVFVSVLYSGLIFAFNEFFLKKYMHLKRNYMKLFVEPLICAAIMGVSAFFIYYAIYAVLQNTGDLSMYFMNAVSLFPALIAAIFIYFFLMVKKGVMTKENIASVPKGAKIIAVLTKMHWFPKEK